MRRRASDLHPPLVDRRRAGAVRRRLFRRLRRDRHPPDAPERRALQLLGIPGRHLDLSERPLLSRRLSRRRQAGRGAQGPGVPRLHRGDGEEEGQGGDPARAGRAALEQQRLSEPVVHEPVPAAARGASDRGQPHRRLHLQFPPQGRAGTDVPQHHQLRQHRQRHRLAGADRRSRNLQSHRHGTVERRRRMDRDRPRIRERRARRPWRPARPEFDQRSLHPQHARRLARLHDQRPRRAMRARAS